MRSTLGLVLFVMALLIAGEVRPWSQPGVTAPVSVANGGTGQTTTAASFDALAPTTTFGDMIARSSTANVRVPIGTSGQVLTVVSGAPAWAAAGGGGTPTASASYVFQFNLNGNASSTIGQLTKAGITTANPAGLYATTSGGNPGINNGSVDPYLAPVNLSFTSAVLKVAYAAVGTGTFASPATAKFDLYRLNYSTRTKLGTFTFNVTNADVFNNLGSDRYGSYTTTASLTVTAGDTFGVEFLNEGSTNSQINALGGIYMVAVGTPY